MPLVLVLVVPLQTRERRKMPVLLLLLFLLHVVLAIAAANTHNAAAVAATGAGGRGPPLPPPPSEEEERDEDDEHDVGFPCQPPRHSAYLFCNTSLSVADRARSLVAALTLHEKVGQLSDMAAPLPRLGIPAYRWWSESLHGVAANGPGVNFDRGPIRAATVFPQVILSAASFNRTLWSAVARAVAVEARAMYNAGQAGLTFWAPNINIFRDPRWGRGQETPGEDPLVASSYAVEYVRAFQGTTTTAAAAAATTPHKTPGSTRSRRRHLRSTPGQREDVGAESSLTAATSSSSLMVSACCKHYTAYDLEKWGNFSRYSFDARVTEQDMRDTYQPPFRSCVREGRASCLMCSYNEVNGVPSCASGHLLREARADWDLQGYVTSDCNAVATIYEYQKYVQSPEDAVADALRAGVDINCGGYYLLYTESAIEQGKLLEEDVDRALFNLFSVQLRLGLYDGDPKKHRYGRLGPGDVCTAEHRALALEGARQGIVLLKNDKQLLPLGQSMRQSSLAVIGPAANNSTVLGGDYSGVPCHPKSVFEGLQAYAEKATFAPGCRDVACVSEDEGELLKEAVRVAEGADVVVVVAGLDLGQETEDLDRVSLLLPGRQADLVTAVAAAASKRRPIVLILMGGGPVDVSFAKEDPRIGSIVWVGYPGEAGGQAVAEAIVGEFNPGGRLPVTWYPESFTEVPMNDMNMRPDPSRGYPGRTYRFYTGDVVYGFGYGLSYSTYSYKLLSAPDRISLLQASSSLSSATHQKQKLALEQGEEKDHVRVDNWLLESCCRALNFEVLISVANHGNMDGSHVVLLYSRPATRQMAGGGAPQKQLVGFQRVHTTAGGATQVGIPVDPCEHLSTVNERGERVLSLGSHVLVLEAVEHTLFLEI